MAKELINHDAEFPQFLSDLTEDGEFQAAWWEEGLIHRVALRAYQYRKASNLSQKEVAKRMATRQPAIARLEAGESNITLRKLARLSLSLRCQPEDLVCEKEPDSLAERWREREEDPERERTVQVQPSDFTVAWMGEGFARAGDRRNERAKAAAA